jgi:hypothetical protein
LSACLSQFFRVIPASIHGFAVFWIFLLPKRFAIASAGILILRFGFLGFPQK